MLPEMSLQGPLKAMKTSHKLCIEPCKIINIPQADQNASRDNHGLPNVRARACMRLCMPGEHLCARACQGVHTGVHLCAHTCVHRCNTEQTDVHCCAHQEVNTSALRLARVCTPVCNCCARCEHRCARRAHRCSHLAQPCTRVFTPGNANEHRCSLFGVNTGVHDFWDQPLLLICSTVTIHCNSLFRAGLSSSGDKSLEVDPNLSTAYV